MDRLHYTIDQWANFLWSDESPFVLRFCKKLGVCGFPLNETVIDIFFILPTTNTKYWIA